jgi:hypothetical protein
MKESKEKRKTLYIEKIFSTARKEKIGVSHRKKKKGEERQGF